MSLPPRPPTFDHPSVRKAIQDSTPLPLTREHYLNKSTRASHTHSMPFEEFNPVWTRLSMAEAKLPFARRQDLLRAERLREEKETIRTETNEKVNSIEAELAWIDRNKRAIQTVHQLETTPKLERLGESLIHSLMAEMDEPFPAPLFPPDGTWQSGERAAWKKCISSPEHGLFVVEHDWAGAFAKAQGDDIGSGELHLPYELSFFEFKVSGFHVVSLWPFSDLTSQAIFVRNPDGWFFFGHFHPHGAEWSLNAKHIHQKPSQLTAKFPAFLAAQVRAVAVALEAQVAVIEPVRAPHRTNAIREAKGKIPLPTYNIVRLAHRGPRLAPSEFTSPTGAKRRLHFRRGHWRHYQSHKTWIKWMLVGDPELGFIDKHYRL